MTPEREEESLGPAEQEVLTEILDELRKHVLREARRLSAGDRIDQTAIVRACAEMGLPAGEPESGEAAVAAEAVPLRGALEEMLQRFPPREPAQASLAPRRAPAVEEAMPQPYTLQSVLGLVLARLSAGNLQAAGNDISLPHWGNALCPRCTTLLAMRKPNVPPRRRWPC